MLRFLVGILSIVAASASVSPTSGSNSMNTTAHLKDFQVIELRRYTVKEGQREHFAQYFDTYFPEALEQLGTIVFGEFFEHDIPSGFTWVRGFHSMEDRAVANAMFYYGPVWKEHRSTMNDLLKDTDNVLLLRPLSPERGVSILPTVDPVTEANGAEGIVVAQIFAVKADSVEAFASDAEKAFASYRAVGVREAGVLVTLDVTNNFPQLPVRTDGPYLVWLGILKNGQMENDFNAVVKRSLQSLSAAGWLRGMPELIILDPTHRSRLRWLP